MLLLPDDVELFYKLHNSLMHFVNRQQNVVPELTPQEEIELLPPEHRLEIRHAFLDHLELIDTFADENPMNLADGELEIVRSWRNVVAGEFFAFRQLKKQMIFLSTDEPTVAYGVLALSKSFEELIGPSLPVMVQTVLLPFKGKIIYDGLISSFSISFGGGIKRMLNEDYREVKQKSGIVESLCVEPTPVSNVKTTKRKSRKNSGKSSKDMKTVLKDILRIVDDFCFEHLNDEYAELCRKLAEKLSCKRPSPLLRGQPKTWASGIVRAIGWVNFLDDPSFEPHMKLSEIDRALDVGKSTGQGKSMEIRKMLKMKPLDTEWTVPSRMDDNPMFWMVEVNGFEIDLRRASREVQEVAFEKGLIPYIPADRETESINENAHTAKAAHNEKIYQLKITLCDLDPPVWRRIQVKNCTLDRLHQHIQSAMGWSNSHLHQFEIDGELYGDPEILNSGFDEFEGIDSTATKIDEMIPENGKRFVFFYEYDFGDSWRHEILFEGFHPAEANRRYPLCLEGERNCPPEDVGGVWGYSDFLEAITNPNHEEYDDYKEWIGDFDPEEFNATKTSKEMTRGVFGWRKA